MHDQSATHEHHRAHQHDAAHPDDAPHENYSARAHPEFVVLDIGEEVGALIVYTDATLHGTEVEISPAGEDSKLSHKDVLERAGGNRPAFTAVFDGLPEGAYTLWTNGTPRARDVLVTGGSVASLDWTTGMHDTP